MPALCKCLHCSTFNGQRISVNAGNVFNGLILAGGQSSRMGQDKSQLLWNGVPLYQHMAGLLDQAGINRIMISSNHLQGANVIADKVPERGPLSGIHAALRQISDGQYLIVVPVDMPLLPVEAIRQLSQEEHTCFYQDFTLPMLLSVTPGLRQQVECSIHSPNRRDYSLWKLHQAMQGQTLIMPESMLTAFGNANTPDDWQKCQRLAAILDDNIN